MEMLGIIHANETSMCLDPHQNCYVVRRSRRKRESLLDDHFLCCDNTIREKKCTQQVLLFLVLYVQNNIDFI